MAIHGSDSQQVVDRLRGLLHSTFEGVTHGAEATSRGLGFGVYMLKLRTRLRPAQALFAEHHSPDDDDRILREAELLFVRRRDAFRGSRTDLLRAWNDVFADATQKVYRDRRDAESYAADAEQWDDDDRDFYAAAGRAARRG